MVVGDLNKSCSAYEIQQRLLAVLVSAYFSKTYFELDSSHGLRSQADHVINDGDTFNRDPKLFEGIEQ
jgi:hypothetical protein